MKNLVFGLYGAPDSANPSFRELTISWSRYGYQGKIIEAATLDGLLQEVVNHDYDFCLVQKAGHVIDEQWYPPSWKRVGFYQAIERHINGSYDFLVVGELDENRLFKDDFLLINMLQYKALRMPDSSRILKSAQRSYDVVNGFSKVINEGRFNLSSGRKSAFGNFLRKDPSLALQSAGLTNEQTTFLKGVVNQTSNSRKGVFLFNIESYNDLVESSGMVDAVFSVAAGFKANRILELNGFDEQTTVVFYDYSKKALEIRQQIVEQWNGEDFPGFIKYIIKTNPAPETFYQLWSGVTPENLDWRDVQWFWEFELDKWGGEQAFKEHWLRYKNLPHQYIHCNLLTDQVKIFKEIGKYDSPFLWWSNAFFTVYSNWYYTNKERKSIYEQWIKALADSNPNCQVNGSDYNNSSVNGLTAKEYWELYREQPSDELDPVNLHKIKIRY